jgi:hypothetical protein
LRGLIQPRNHAETAEDGKPVVSKAGFLVFSRVARALEAENISTAKNAARLASHRRPAESAEDARDVLLDCSQRDHEPVGDSMV